MDAMIKKFWEHDKRDYEIQDIIAMWNANLPDSFSLWVFIGETLNQWKLGSCTAMGTTHSMMIQNTIEHDRKIVLDWKYLWGEIMGHSITKHDGGDYVENALKGAMQWIKELGSNNIFKAEWFAYTQRANSSNLLIKQTLFETKKPIVMAVQWNSKMWAEMTLWEIKAIPTKTTGGHCIIIVAYDEWGIRCLNSRQSNDKEKKKSRFFISWDMIRKLVNARLLWWRYWILFDMKDLKEWISLERYKELKTQKVYLESMQSIMEKVIKDKALSEQFIDETISYVNSCSTKIIDIDNELKKYKE